MDHKVKVIVIHDNPAYYIENKLEFIGSTFHRFLDGFRNIEVHLSAPIVGKIGTKHFDVDGCRVIPRIGYGKAIFFYLLFPFFSLYYLVHYLRLFRNYDLVWLVVPSSSVPLACAAVRFLGKAAFAYVVGDVLEVIKSSTRYPGPLRWLSLIAARWEYLIYRHMLKHLPAVLLDSRIIDRWRLSGSYRVGMTSLVEDREVQKPRLIRKGKVRILFVGRLAPEKGVDLLIRSLRYVKSFSYELIIAGDGPERTRLEEMVLVYGIKDHVRFEGFVERDRLRQLYCYSDIFVLPSRSEGTPKSLLEAMAYGLPVIASDVGRCREILDDGKRGLLVLPEDAMALASALEEVVRERNRETYERQRRAYSYIREHTKEKEAARLEEWMLTIIKGEKV
ncbi:glycosyltransferase [Candidatus Parcubacteria bacterium]|nr:MAG: glycosyltransferase [Candidatus Parcubacteria bacterium]